MLYQFLEWSCMAGALTAFLYKLPALRHSRTDPVIHALCWYFLLSFLSFFLGLDAVWPHIADAFGYKNVTTILIHCIIILLTAAQQVVLVYWSYAPTEAKLRARRRLATFGVILVILIVMFYRALPSERHGTAETASLVNMHNPRYVTYLALYLATIAAGQLLTVVMSLRYARIAPRLWLRRGMRTVATGAVFILIYCATRYVEIVGIQLGADMSPWDPAQWITGDIGSLFELIGWTIPGWGPTLAGGSQWLADYWAYHRLRPLWFALCQAMPDIAMDPPRPRVTELLPQRRLGVQVRRRVVEIMDGLRELQAHINVADADHALQQARAAGLTDDRLHLTTYAIQVHAALNARAADKPPPNIPTGKLTSPHADDTSIKIDASSETKWLMQLAVAFTRYAHLRENEALGMKEPG